MEIGDICIYIYIVRVFRPTRILFIRLARRRYSLFVVVRCSRRITLDARIFILTVVIVAFSFFPQIS